MNDGIEKDLSSVMCTSFGFAINLVREAGLGTLVAKANIESAFRTLPLHPHNLCMLGYKFNRGYYINMCLLIGNTIYC